MTIFARKIPRHNYSAKDINNAHSTIYENAQTYELHDISPISRAFDRTSSYTRSSRVPACDPTLKTCSLILTSNRMFKKQEYDKCNHHPARYLNKTGVYRVLRGEFKNFKKVFQ